MGILTKAIKEIPKLDVPYTVLRNVSVSDGKEVSFQIIDDCYSLHGKIVETLECWSFDEDEEDVELYNGFVKMCLIKIQIVQKLIVAGKLGELTPEQIKMLFS